MGKIVTPKQERFVENFLLDLNATQAAIRAGYSERTAGSQGGRLLQNVEIQAAIDKRRAVLSDRLEITQDRILREYARIAFADMRRFVAVEVPVNEKGTPVGPMGVRMNPSADWTDDDAAAVSEVSETTTENGGSLKFKLHSKVQALDSLAKHLGMFVNRIKHSGPGAPLATRDAQAIIHAAIDRAIAAKSENDGPR